MLGFFKKKDPFMDKLLEHLKEREGYKQSVYLGLLNDSGISSGRIVINEIMQNPSAVSDSDGEWFEIYNDSQDTVDLTDWIVRDAGSDAFVISSGFPIWREHGFVAFGACFIVCPWLPIAKISLLFN